jgi:DNA-binding transcriptional ArsR family regulator
MESGREGDRAVSPGRVSAPIFDKSSLSGDPTLLTNFQKHRYNKIVEIFIQKEFVMRALAKRAPPEDFRGVADRFKQVSDLTRLHVLVLLGANEHSVGELSTRVGASMSALSRHLALLRLAGVVISTRTGQRNVYALTIPGRAIWRVVMVLVG